MKDWQTVVVIVVVLALVASAGFFIGSNLPKHIARVDRELEGIVREIMSYNPDSWSLAYNSYYSHNGFRLTIRKADLEVEIKDKKKLSDIEIELFRLRDYLK